MTFDITQAATWVPIVAGVLIPFAVAIIAKQDAAPTVKSVLAALGAALTALALYLADTAHVLTWAGAASVFILALVSAAASRVTLTQHLVSATDAKVTGVVG